MKTEKTPDGNLENREKALHYTMSVVGGIFANYSLLEYCNVFGSAETSNMILLVKNLLYWDPFYVVIRVVSLIMYAAGITMALWLSKKHSSVQRLTCIVIDCAAALVLGLLPLNLNPIVALYPVGFSMSIQWCTFRGVGGNPSATTFSTGNFRQLVSSFYGLFVEGKREALGNIRFYLITMLSFHMGILVMYLIWPHMTHSSIWIAFVPLLAAIAQERQMLHQQIQGSVSSKENIDV